MAYAELDDAGLAKLAPLLRLETLNLDSTHVTDAGVMLLTGFPKLRQLDIYHSLLTAGGLAALRAAVPELRVIWDKESGMPHRRRA